MILKIPTRTMEAIGHNLDNRRTFYRDVTILTQLYFQKYFFHFTYRTIKKNVL